MINYQFLKLSVILCLIVLLNAATPRTRKDSVVEHLAPQGQGLAVIVFLFGITWGFGYQSFIRQPDVEMPDFYPIFCILFSWMGVFFLCFLGFSSKRFRNAMLGRGRKSVRIHNSSYYACKLKNNSKIISIIQGKFMLNMNIEEDEDEDWSEEEDDDEDERAKSARSTTSTIPEESEEDESEEETSSSSSSSSDEEQDEENIE